MAEKKDKKKPFKEVNTRAKFPEIEENILDFWKEEKIFEKSVEDRPADKTWTFLDGPPFITGMPHYGSLLSSIPKDVYPRFWTMKGYKVRRVWGWDCHGLPAENKVENKLGLDSKKEIEEKVGVKKFIDECKLYVSDVSAEWEWYVDHIGRWVDFKNAYKTMDTEYMETVMWVFKQIYDRGHIYKGLRVSLYCPHCSTPISNFEVAMDADNYKEVTEPSNVYKYKVEGEEDTYLLAWSTTPWNKLATPALAVNPKIKYVKVEQGDEFYILAKKTTGILHKEPEWKIVDEFKGEELLGKKFEPHYDLYDIDEDKRVWVVIGGDFVSAKEGTGIVTIAAYGEDDLAVMQKENIQTILHVDEEGYILKRIPKWGGIYYLDANPLVNQDLADRGLMYKEEHYTHTVPTCWRCHTRLIYAPQDAWYVDVQSLKDKLLETNENVNWFPQHFKHGRYKKSVEAAPDWCISRSRYWGSPVPVWECECGERYVPGSIKELEELSGEKVKDLHKPEIDDVTIKCKKCEGSARRVPEVLDSWIEAGSAPFAERHFPFEKELKLEDFFPPDFIVEYTGQIRAWFYVLHVIAVALYGSEAFKNVIVTGVILGNDGRKMSKNYGNYPDPKKMLENYGGDALRLYLMGSPVMRGEDIIISEEEYRNQVRGFMLPLWNVYNFFVTYANADNWKPVKAGKTSESNNVLDRWIVSELNSYLEELTKAFEEYDTPLTISLAREFLVNQLSGWYVRRIRDRVGPTAKDTKDKEAAYRTLYYVLTSFVRSIAPIAPFMTEEIYKNLTNELSVHLQYWPFADRGLVNEGLEKEMAEARRVVEIAHSTRKKEAIKVRQPLSALETETQVELSQEIMEVIADEVNVLEVTNKVAKNTDAKLNTKLNEELEKMGEARELARRIQLQRRDLGTALDEQVIVTLPDWPKEFEDEIKQRALVKEIRQGEFKVERI